MRTLQVVAILLTAAAAPMLERATPGASALQAGSQATLQTEVQRLIDSPQWGNDRWSVMVISLDRGDTLVSIGGSETLAPASNMKLFTTAAALHYLGAQYRFTTFLLADGRIENGVLDGDLILYGTGDPTLSDRFGQKMAVWNAFADTIAALGIREIRGSIIGDASYFGGPGAAEGWQPTYMNASYAAPASALSYAENIVTLMIRPGPQAGWRPTVQVIPGGDGIAIVNEATTVARGRTSLHVARAAYDGPIVIRGQIVAGSGGMLRTVPLGDPQRWAAAVLRETLQKRGIPVAGGVKAVQDPEDSPVSGRAVFAPAFSQKEPLRVLAMHQSPPLIEVLEVINKKSHNLLAEQTLRAVGRVAVGKGTVDAGARAVLAMLGREGDDGDDSSPRIYDGSGLSILNRATARDIVELLAFMANSPTFDDYYFTLPEAGARDGLTRMGGTPAQGNLRAKTGTINYVSALSGYVKAANGERLAFSIIANNVPSTYRAKRIEDAIGARLASYSRPVAGATAPMPGSGAAPDAVRQSTGPADTPATNTAKANLPAPSPASAASSPAATPARARTHTIRKGDTLDGIAKRYGTTVTALRNANPGLDPRRLIPGKTVRLP